MSAADVAQSGIAIPIALPATRPLAAPIKATLGERLTAGFFATACLAVLIVAWRLTPASAGIGTHQQLGLPACGWMQAANMPCPTCGMTTAFAAAANARPAEAFIAQPMGAVLAVATAAMFWACLHIAATGSQLGRLLVRILRPRVLFVALGAGIAAWVYKIGVVRGW